MQKHKPRRWHIDYLTTHPRISGIGAYVSCDGCLTEPSLARLCATRFPVVPRFGNSDRRSTTSGHLFLLQPQR
jgi:Uri superfamily endonuclease